MSWNFLDILEVMADALNLFHSDSGKKNLNDHDKLQRKKIKYFTEKLSTGFMLAAVILFIMVFKDPLPRENDVQTLIFASLIGIAISFLLFFVLYVLDYYYFKSIFKLIFFSCSVIAFFIALVLYIYFRSGIYI